MLLKRGEEKKKNVSTKKAIAFTSFSSSLAGNRLNFSNLTNVKPCQKAYTSPMYTATLHTHPHPFVRRACAYYASGVQCMQQGGKGFKT